MGETFYSRVRTWFHNLQWPPTEEWGPQEQGMLLMELYANFVAVANTEAPVNIGPKRKSVQHVLLDEQPIYRGDGATCMCVLHVLLFVVF